MLSTKQLNMNDIYLIILNKMFKYNYYYIYFYQLKLIFISKSNAVVLYIQSKIVFKYSGILFLKNIN